MNTPSFSIAAEWIPIDTWKLCQRPVRKRDRTQTTFSRLSFLKCCPATLFRNRRFWNEF